MSSHLLPPPFQNNVKSIYIILGLKDILLLQSHRRMLRLPSTQNQNIGVLHSYWLRKWDMSDLTNSTPDGRAKQVNVIQSDSPTMKNRRGSCWKWRLFQYGVCCWGRKWQWNLLDSWQYPSHIFCVFLFDESV